MLLWGGPSCGRLWRRVFVGVTCFSLTFVTEIQRVARRDHEDGGARRANRLLLARRRRRRSGRPRDGQRRLGRYIYVSICISSSLYLSIYLSFSPDNLIWINRSIYFARRRRRRSGRPRDGQRRLGIHVCILYVYLSIYLSICLSISISIYVDTYINMFARRRRRRPG